MNTKLSTRQKFMSRLYSDYEIYKGVLQFPPTLKGKMVSHYDIVIANDIIAYIHINLSKNMNGRIS